MKIYKYINVVLVMLAVIIVFTLVVFQSCSDVIDNEKKAEVIQNQNEHIFGMDQLVKSTTRFSFSKTAGRFKVKNSLSTKNDGTLINELFQSATWSNLPKEILSDIQFSDSIAISDYKNTSVKTICFNLKTDKIYKSLVFYCKNSKFIPVIASSEIRGDMKYLAISNLSSKPYFDFYVNNKNKMGKFKIYANIPRFTGMSNVRMKSKATEDTRTCPEKTSSFGDCMLCAINECAQDWVCAVVCGVMSPECLAGFAIACTIG